MLSKTVRLLCLFVVTLSLIACSRQNKLLQLPKDQSLQLICRAQMCAGQQDFKKYGREAQALYADCVQKPGNVNAAFHSVFGVKDYCDRYFNSMRRCLQHDRGKRVSVTVADLSDPAVLRYIGGEQADKVATDADKPISVMSPAALRRAVTGDFTPGEEALIDLTRYRCSPLERDKAIAEEKSRQAYLDGWHTLYAPYYQAQQGLRQAGYDFDRAKHALQLYIARYNRAVTGSNAWLTRDIPRDRKRIAANIAAVKLTQEQYEQVLAQCAAAARDLTDYLRNNQKYGGKYNTYSVTEMEKAMADAERKFDMAKQEAQKLLSAGQAILQTPVPAAGQHTATKEQPGDGQPHRHDSSDVSSDTLHTVQDGMHKAQDAMKKAGDWLRKISH